MITIPKQIEGLNFVLISNDGKKPYEKGWHKKIHRIDCPILQKHLSDGKNYGVQSNNSSVIIDGKNYFLIIMDFDKKDFMDKVISLFPETFTTTSGSSKKCCHLWFASDNNVPFKIKNEKLEILADIIGAGNQVIAPGSKHPSGSIYSVVKDIPIAFMPYAEIEAKLKPYDMTPKKMEKPKKQFIQKKVGNEVAEKILNSVSMSAILEELGIDTSKNPTNCFGHSSIGGKCFSWTEETAHCFHCQNWNEGWNKYSLIRDAKNLTDKETFEWFAEKANMKEHLQKSRKDFAERNNKDLIPDMEISNLIFNYFGMKDLARQILDIHPFYYDPAKNWWMWKEKKFCWELVDETDLLNWVSKLSTANTIKSRDKGEIIEAMKQEARLRKPREICPAWVQFRENLIDINTGEERKASPEYFVTNPIPYELHQERFVKTPVMDRIFEEWVGREYVPTLYEIIAFCLLPDYPIHRLFCFIGGGLNGKTCFLRLLKKFIGENNITSTELDTLLESRFEITRLHKKLVCIMGETNFAEISKTSIIKKLTGQDLIGFEYKNKNPFEGSNYAKIIIATNNLPTTTDKTIGFYRRWLIIDFPNRFSEEKDILEDIPEEEYEMLAVKCCLILKDLLRARKFSKEGTIEERQEKYENKSNFLARFIKDFITNEDIDGYITIRDFHKQFANWCKENRHREISETSLGMDMKKLGYEQERKYFNWVNDGKGGTARVWIGIKWRT